MLGLLGVVRPRWPHLALGRSRRAGLDIHGHIFFENLLTQQGPSHTSILYWDKAIGIQDVGGLPLRVIRAEPHDQKRVG
jgi:hypothetical protein